MRHPGRGAPFGIKQQQGEALVFIVSVPLSEIACEVSISTSAWATPKYDGT
jgi:hypothetical protein